jgi:hypothetical protein
MASMNVFGMLEGCSNDLFRRSYSLRFDGPRKVMKGVPIVVVAIGLQWGLGRQFVKGVVDVAIVDWGEYIVLQD